jgi:hypothetical protein
LADPSAQSFATPFLLSRSEYLFRYSVLHILHKWPNCLCAWSLPSSLSATVSFPWKPKQVPTYLTSPPSPLPYLLYLTYLPTLCSELLPYLLCRASFFPHTTTSQLYLLRVPFLFLILPYFKLVSKTKPKAPIEH